MQDIFADYKQPFAVTYLGASLMAVYLPIAFVKDCICKSLAKRSSKKGKNEANADNSLSALDSTLKYSGMQAFELECQTSLHRDDSETNLTGREEGKPLISHDADLARQNKELSAKDIAKYGFYIAPIWFITEVILYDLCSCF